jgi:hypothetical protein
MIKAAATSPGADALAERAMRRIETDRKDPERTARRARQDQNRPRRNAYQADAKKLAKLTMCCGPSL